MCIVEQPRARLVERACAGFAPKQEAPQQRLVVARPLGGTAKGALRLRVGHGMTHALDHAPAILGEPVAAAQRAQFFGEQRMQFGQICDILRRVIQLRETERALQPVRARFGFGQIDAQQQGDEFLVAHAKAETGHRGGDLRVEQIGRPFRHDHGERFEILAGAVHHAHARRITQTHRERGMLAEFGRIEKRGCTVDIHLQQRQPWREGIGAHELGIETDQCMRRTQGHPGVERGRVVNPLVHQETLCSRAGRIRTDRNGEWFCDAATICRKGGPRFSCEAKAHSLRCSRRIVSQNI